MRKTMILLLIVFSIMISGCSSLYVHKIPIIKQKVDPVGVYAFLNESTATTCTVADTWYPISGIFINNPVENFFVNVSIPAIVYKYKDPLYMEIQAHASIRSNLPGTNVHVSMSVNGVIQEQLGHEIFLRNIGEVYGISGNGVEYLQKGDWVQLVMKCDKTATITFDHLTTSIRRFY